MTSSPTGTLFDQFQRTDSSLMAYGGSVFDFCNRVDRPEWARVRDELEDWYSHYPDCDGELRKRFRNKRRNDQHFGAWWELYMFTFYRRLGYEIAVHPTLPNDKETKPDFLVTRDGETLHPRVAALADGREVPGIHGLELPDDHWARALGLDRNWTLGADDVLRRARRAGALS